MPAPYSVYCVPHPLQEKTEKGPLLFYPEAEAVLAKVPRRGIPIVLRQYRDGTVKPWNSMRLGKVVRDLRAKLGLPETFTLDACRHGGMTELEEAELTDGQGRALSAHRSKAGAGGYPEAPCLATDERSQHSVSE
jgi:hypothetical protein